MEQVTACLSLQDFRENLNHLKTRICEINNEKQKCETRISEIINERRKCETRISEINNEKVIFLKKQNKYKQRTTRWFEVRRKLLTSSSDVGDILGESEYGGSFEKTIKKKTTKQKPFKGNKFTNHGIKYENIAIQIYEQRFNKKVHHFGLFIHPTIPYLGASPDGITEDGRLVEIKVPFLRIPNGKVKKGYYIQTQTQMQVFDIDVCDLFECRISEYKNKKDYAEDVFIGIPQKNINIPIDRLTEHGLEKGMIGRIGYYSAANENKYFYPPSNVSSEKQFDWLKDKQLEKNKHGFDLHIDFWKLEVTSLTEIKRDNNWWEEKKVKQKLHQAWQQIEAKVK